MAIDQAKIMDEVRQKFNCVHENCEIRKKKDKADRWMIALQCVQCGQKKGDYLSPRKFSPADIQKMPDWNAEIESLRDEEYGCSVRSRIQEEKERQRLEFLKQHDEFLKSEVWKKIRKKVLRRAEGICEGCAEADATQIHHLNYDRWGGNELLIDLVAVCDLCHQKLHPTSRHTVDILIESRNLPGNNRGAFSPTVSPS